MAQVATQLAVIPGRVIRKAFGVAYAITNRTNGKCYIGIATNSRGRWNEHKLAARQDTASRGCCPALRSAMRKYGVENFQFDVVASSATWADLCLLERQLIQQHACHVRGGGGYNLTKGGEGMLGFQFSEASRAKMSSSARSRKRGPVSEEARANISAAQTGKKRSENAKAKMRSAKAGRALSLEHKDAIRAGLAGRPKTEAHKEKLRQIKRPDVSERLKAWHARSAAE